MLYPNELRAHLQSRMNSAQTKFCTKLVGVERFELPTSCSQSRRATRLRYTPESFCLPAVLISLLRREITKCILHFALRVALSRDKIAPGDFYRTPDILLPKQARYQTALYPDAATAFGEGGA